MTDEPEVSIVLPVYNEAAGLVGSLAVITEQMEHIGRSFELVCVDDGSDDGTASVLRDAAAGDERIQCVELSRNFGKESALTAGLAAARGRAVILMDADLQHPPRLIARMVELWDEGYDVVNGVKQSRGRESGRYRLMARLFYALMGRAAGAGLHRASDFKLLDRQVVDAVLQLSERNRFFRGLVAWVGYRVAEVPFEVGERTGGRSKWSTWALMRYSMGNLVAFSSFPLRLVASIGVLAVLLVLGLAGHTVYRYAAGTAAEGFPTVILLQIFLGGLILGCLGVLAVYVSSMYEELKARPLFLVRRARSPRSKREMGTGAKATDADVEPGGPSSAQE